MPLWALLPCASSHTLAPLGPERRNGPTLQPKTWPFRTMRVESLVLLLFLCAGKRLLAVDSSGLLDVHCSSVVLGPVALDGGA